MKANAYSYIRFSTRDQLKGDSQRRQAEAAAAWCKTHGVKLADTYPDLGVSAYRGANRETGKLGLFLKAVQTGKIPRGSILLVESFDRISREHIKAALRLFMDIMSAGIDVVTLMDGRRYSESTLDLTDLIVMLTIASRAHEESQTKSLRVKQAWSKRRDMAKATSQPMPGRIVSWVSRRYDGKFELIPERAKIVRRIFNMALEGKGALAIAQKLTAEKVPGMGPSGKWHPGYVVKLLRSRTVIGTISSIGPNGEKLEPMENYYPPVVSKQVFATINAREFDRPSKRGRRGNGSLFTGLLFDRASGTPVYVQYNRRLQKKAGGGTEAKRYKYLVSRAGIMGQAPRSSWRYDEFLDSFIALTHKASLSKAGALRDGENEIDVAKSELGETEKQAARLAEFLAAGNASDAVAKRLTELENQRLKLRERIQALESKRESAPVAVNDVDWTDDAALRENLVATVKRITMDAGKRSFVAEFLDGRSYSYSEQGDKVTIKKTE